MFPPNAYRDDKPELPNTFEREPTVVRIQDGVAARSNNDGVEEGNLHLHSAQLTKPIFVLYAPLQTTTSQQIYWNISYHVILFYL